MSDNVYFRKTTLGEQKCPVPPNRGLGPSNVRDINRECQLVRNLLAYPAVFQGVYTLRWDEPFDYDIKQPKYLGVNIYRSWDSPYEGFQKLNSIPVQVPTFMDSPNMILKKEHPLKVHFLKDNYNKSWLRIEASNLVSKPFNFNVKSYSLVKIINELKDYNTPLSFYNSAELKLTHKGEELRVEFINEGYLYIRVFRDFDVITHTNKWVKIDLNPNNWFIEYYTPSHTQPLEMIKTVYYRAILVDKEGKEVTTLLDSPLATPSNSDVIDWMWREGSRRIFWMFQQNGERVNLFIRKYFGELCNCYTKNRIDSCPDCLGTGIKGGGYYGPYRILMVFDDTVRSREYQKWGYRNKTESPVTHIPFPILRQGDIIIRPDGSQNVVGEVTSSNVRGVILQQTFSTSEISGQKAAYLSTQTYVDEPVIKLADSYTPGRPVVEKLVSEGGDLEYMIDPETKEIVVAPESNSRHPYDFRREKGKTPSFENITYF